ncbi:unnamed protein product [Closterium sp. NIES-65]|nr:unnamed protein product [Closterium sp. NIES-65]
MIIFGGSKINAVAVSLQYLLSLLAVSLLAAVVPVAGNPPLPPAVAPPATPRLVLLANNSFDAKCLDGSASAGARRISAAAPSILKTPPTWYAALYPLKPPSPPKAPLGSSTFYPHDPPNANLSPGFNGILNSSNEAAISQLEPCSSFLSPPPLPHSPLQNLSPGFYGMLSSNSSINPHFHNWNLVRLIYCDGGGYSGTAGRVEVGSNGNSTTIYLDGWKIVQAVIQDLKSKQGIRSADQILLVGSSAGGQAAVALCDRIAGAFPWAATKCVSDSGFFIDSKDREGGNTWRVSALLRAVSPIPPVLPPSPTSPCMPHPPHDTIFRFQGPKGREHVACQRTEPG